MVYGGVGDGAMKRLCYAYNSTYMICGMCVPHCHTFLFIFRGHVRKSTYDTAHGEHHTEWMSGVEVGK